MRRLTALVASLVLLVAACTSTSDETTTTAEATTTLPPTTTLSPATTTTTVFTSAADAGLPWWNDRVFYEVFVRSFADSDGDGIGDFNGLTDRLDYLNDGDPTTDTDLGITGIWLMPITQSPSYHGYDVVDYRTIEEDYGTQEDFERFLDAAHDRGIAVITDLVMNHSSRSHPWFLESANPESPLRDWYVWSDIDPGWIGPWGQDVWHPRGDTFYYGLFWEGMPDLNLENDEVTAEIMDIATYWIDDMGVDGFRLDAAKHLIEEGEVMENTVATLDWLADFTSAMHDLDENAMIVGEVWADAEVVAEYVPRSLDLSFDFDIGGAFLDAMTAWDAQPLEEGIVASLEGFPEGRYAPFLTNHDQDRIISQLSGVWERAEIAAVFLLTLPGTPFVYYGEEVGLAGTKPDELIRTPMPWNGESPSVGFTEGTPWQPADPGYPDANVASQTGDSGSLLSTYRTLINYRNTSSALRLGSTTVLDPESGEVFAMLRSHDDTHVLTLLNLSGREVLAGPLDLSALGSSATASTIHGDGPDGTIGELANHVPVDVMPPFSAYVIELTIDD